MNAVTVATAPAPVVVERPPAAATAEYLRGWHDALLMLQAHDMAALPPYDDTLPVGYPPAPAGRFRIVGSND